MKSFFVAILWHVTSLRLIPAIYIKVFLDCLSTSLLGVKITALLNPQPHTLVDTHALHKDPGLTNLCHYSVTPQDFLFLALATALCRYCVFIPDSHRISGWRRPPLTGRREKAQIDFHVRCVWALPVATWKAAHWAPSLFNWSSCFWNVAVIRPREAHHLSLLSLPSPP